MHFNHSYFLLAFSCFFFLLTACQDLSPSSVPSCSNDSSSNTGNVRPIAAEATSPDVAATFGEEDLRYKGEMIKITHHARCRMGCRNIEAIEIQEIIDKRKINYRKSKSNPPPGKCPSIAFEGRTERDRQKIRVILGECENKPIIITVIDLENEYRCHCK